jgi:hypothetical protein
VTTKTYFCRDKSFFGHDKTYLGDDKSYFGRDLSDQDPAVFVEISDFAE